MKEDELAVYRLIARFANSFDLKAWMELGECLAAELHTDYSDLRGTPPEAMSRERFVELRRVALQELRTHHLLTNLEVDLTGGEGGVKASALILRRNSAGEVFNTHCLYTFGVRKEASQWLIRSIVQKVFWSDGQAAIHKGVKSL